MAAVLAVLGALLTVAPPDAALPEASAASAQKLRVASFNIRSVSLSPSGSVKSWKDRRAAVVSTIMSDRPDVLGVQEANPSRHWKSRLVSGDNQFQDLRNGLNAAGGNYRLTNSWAFNCVNAATNYNCTPKARGASGGQRILYNADRVGLVSQGAVKYAKQEAGAEPRYLVWAVLQLKSNGSRFYFVNTHLADSPEAVLLAQWKGLVGWVKSHAAGRPVVVVGDFNTSKWNYTAQSMLPAMKQAGFGDVLNSEYKELRPSPLRARDMVNGWVNTYNGGSRDLRTFSYFDRRDIPGKGIDWVFASNHLAVPQYKVVLRFDPLSLLVSGTLPSDHNMVRADLMVP